MTADRQRRIQNLVVRMQQPFLDTPALRLTLSQVQRRFFTSAVTSEAVLSVLVEAGVLTRTPRGQYMRLFPRSAGRVAA